MNSAVPFEISYHNFGHESLSNITADNMDDTFRLGVAYHKRIGSKLTAECPPWNNNPQSEKYPIYVDNGIFVFNRSEAGTGLPYEVIDNLWIVSRNGYFTPSSDLTGDIDSAIANGTVIAYYSHPEDGFQGSSRGGFQTSLAYARSKVDSGDLWATTLSEIGRYWEAKSDVNTTTAVVSGDTITVDINLANYDAQRFGIPYLTFVTTMPNAESYAKITVNYPTTQILNSSAVRISDSNVIYTIYLNPAGTTNVEIQGVDISLYGRRQHQYAGSQYRFNAADGCKQRPAGNDNGGGKQHGRLIFRQYNLSVQHRPERFKNNGLQRRRRHMADDDRTIRGERPYQLLCKRY